MIYLYFIFLIVCLQKKNTFFLGGGRNCFCDPLHHKIILMVLNFRNCNNFQNQSQEGVYGELAFLLVINTQNIKKVVDNLLLALYKVSAYLNNGSVLRLKSNILEIH